MAFCSVGFAAIKAGTPSSSTYYLLTYTYTYFLILPIKTYRCHKTNKNQITKQRWFLMNHSKPRGIQFFLVSPIKTKSMRLFTDSGQWRSELRIRDSSSDVIFLVSWLKEMLEVVRCRHLKIVTISVLNLHLRGFVCFVSAFSFIFNYYCSSEESTFLVCSNI